MHGRLRALGWLMAGWVVWTSIPLGAAEAGLVAKPLPVREAVVGPLFELVAPEHSGVDLVPRYPVNASLVLMQEQGAGGGVAAGDFDGDQLPDLFVTNHNQGCRLYRNLGGWKFEDVTGKAGIETRGRWCQGTSFVDVDGDGDLDLFVACFNAPNLMFLNRGNGRFEERAREMGLDWIGASVHGAFADYDRDGRLDLFLLTHRDALHSQQRLPANTREAADRGLLRLGANRRPEVAPEFRDLFQLIEKGDGRVELAIAGQPDQLFHQEADGSFRNVTAESGIRGQDIGLGVSWWDFNSDGWPDIYVGNDHRTPDRLWRNNGNGTFTEVAGGILASVPLASMGTDVADVNNDGFVDLLATEMAGSTHARRMVIQQDPVRNAWFLHHANPAQPPRNHLFLATGGERVLETARLAGLEATDWTWSPKFGDFDNDGWVDLYIANGASRDYVNADLQSVMAGARAPGWRSQPLLRERHLAYANRGGLRFEETAARWGLDRRAASFGAAVADFDGDGALDLAVMNLEEPVSLYRNREASGHRLVLRLQGTGGNTWGLGAVVRAETAQGVLTRSLQLASGFLSANEPLVHFGLGSVDRVSRLTVDWPGGSRQVFQDLAADRAYTLTEPRVAKRERWPANAPVEPLFRAEPAGEGLSHRERAMDELAREPLLPWALSRLGPGLAVGDIDGDGDEDFYLGGAAGQPGRLGVQDEAGRFRSVVPPVFERDRECEDFGALLFEADGDGDLDLYVVSGGVEADPGSPRYQDRLLLNDGRGSFVDAPKGSLPEERLSGGVVCAADFDRDGDLDLFVGGRFIPGRYLESPSSTLLENREGRFVEVTRERAPGVALGGMVTGALWLDADDDGWIDLVTSSEWGPLRLFLNRGGRLEAGDGGGEFGRRPGLWQALAAADLDGDGDLDLVASNFGVNTRFRASAAAPLVLWRHEFEPDRPAQLLEAFQEAGEWRFARRREVLGAVLPTLALRFPTFQSFATGTVSQWVPESTLARAAQGRVTTLESGVWWNNGKGRFVFRALPALAQLAPAFGTVASDLDGDGHPDIALVQNLHGGTADSGRMDGGLGVLLRGDGKGAFEPIPPGRSGFVLPEDYRALALIHRTGNPGPALLAAKNDGALTVLLRSATPTSDGLRVQLHGRAGNPTGVGARVEVRLLPARENGAQVGEVRAGGGYLSQDSPILTFAVPSKEASVQVLVRWPDGLRSEAIAGPGVRRLVVRHPRVGGR